MFILFDIKNFDYFKLQNNFLKTIEISIENFYILHTGLSEKNNENCTLYQLYKKNFNSRKLLKKTINFKKLLKIIKNLLISQKNLFQNIRIE